MTDRYQVIREALPALIAEAQAKGGRNERAALIVELLEERDALQAEVEWLRAEVAALNAQIAELEEENADLEAQTAPQSAPAGEREAFETWWPTGRKTIDKANGLSMFKAGAAWQRTQSAGVPEDLRAAMLAVIDRSDWRTAANRAELRALLAAAPKPPAPEPVSPWIRLTDRMPNPEEHGRVLIYTEGYDFGGEQVFDVRAETLNESYFESPDQQPEVLRFASHWMPIPAVSALAAAPVAAQKEGDARDAAIDAALAKVGAA